MRTPTDLSQYSERVVREILPGVSRSFYITLKVLPRVVRQPICLGYLLARATDTLADTESVPVEERLEALDCLSRSVAEGAKVAELVEVLERFGRVQENAAEARLIAETPMLVNWLAAFSEDDQRDIKEVIFQITQGQRFDLERFGGAGSVVRLESAAELEHYTYQVAGCVGEFWTRVCMRHLPRFATLDHADLQTCGVAFGKGLQLVNILRDLPEDLAAGRCYLPNAELAAGGKGSAIDLSNPSPCFAPELKLWSARARSYLADGWRYTLAMRSLRLRFACAIPVLLGLKTLTLVEAQPGVGGVKVSRQDVKRLLVQVMLRLGSRSALDRMMQRISRLSG